MVLDAPCWQEAVPLVTKQPQMLVERGADTRLLRMSWLHIPDVWLMSLQEALFQEKCPFKSLIQSYCLNVSSYHVLSHTHTKDYAICTLFNKPSQKTYSVPPTDLNTSQITRPSSQLPFEVSAIITYDLPIEKWRLREPQPPFPLFPTDPRPHTFSGPQLLKYFRGLDSYPFSASIPAVWLWASHCTSLSLYFSIKKKKKKNTVPISVIKLQWEFT